MAILEIDACADAGMPLCEASYTSGGERPLIIVAG